MPTTETTPTPPAPKVDETKADEVLTALPHRAHTSCRASAKPNRAMPKRIARGHTASPVSPARPAPRPIAHGVRWRRRPAPRISIPRGANWQSRLLARLERYKRYPTQRKPARACTALLPQHHHRAACTVCASAQLRPRRSPAALSAAPRRAAAATAGRLRRTAHSDRCANSIRHPLMRRASTQVRAAPSRSRLTRVNHEKRLNATTTAVHLRSSPPL